MIGIMKLIVLLINKSVSVNFLLASAKRASSWCSLLKALITGRPVKISLVTKFNLSTSFWIILNFGIAMTNKASITTMIAPIPKPMILVIPALVEWALITPPTAIIGA